MKQDRDTATLAIELRSAWLDALQGKMSVTEAWYCVARRAKELK